jgi:hypothetical protein
VVAAFEERTPGQRRRLANVLREWAKHTCLCDMGASDLSATAACSRDTFVVTFDRALDDALRAAWRVPRSRHTSQDQSASAEEDRGDPQPTHHGLHGLYVVRADPRREDLTG